MAWRKAVGVIVATWCDGVRQDWYGGCGVMEVREKEGWRGVV